MLIILITGLLISNLAGQELNQLSIVGKATRPAGEIVPGDKLDANKNQAALISFITDLDVDMDFKPWNGAVGKITNPAMGRWNVYVSPGERAIDVHAEGFKPLKVVLSSFGINNVKSGEVYKLEITGERKADLIPVMISSNQSGAEVFVDGESKGKTENKMLSIKLGAGERKIKIEKSGFATQTIMEDITEDNFSFHFELVPAMPATVKITTEPEGAEVFIENNVKLGVTPLAKFYDGGTYPIKIEKENYETINEQITITEPETNKHYVLKDIRATLTVKTYPNATVKFNGESYKGGIENHKISPQALEIFVEMPKAKTITRMITLKPEAVDTLEIYPEVQTGVIQVMVIPSEASFELKGDGGEYYQDTGRQTFMDVPVGEYELSAKADGYKSHRESFELKADETVQKPVQMEEGRDEAKNKKKYNENSEWVITKLDDHEIENVKDENVSELIGNFPNPFNPETNIEFYLKEEDSPFIGAYNVKGQLISKFTEELKKGVYSLKWKPQNIPSGVYFIKFVSLDGSTTIKVIYMK